jgi:hypothetical protein
MHCYIEDMRTRLEELFIFIPKLLFFQGAKLSMVALLAHKLLLNAKKVQVER